MKLTQDIIDKIQKAMLHTKKDGTVNWKDDDEIEVQLAGTFAADRFIVIKNKTKDPVVSAEPHPHFDYEKKVFTKDGREEYMREFVKSKGIPSPDDEKADETYSNTPDEKTQDTDTLVNFHSGGLNRQKATYPKVASGDNPMAMAKEDKITEEELANSLRTQYEGFKQAYQEAAKPDYIDLDKDGNKTEPMKKAAKDAEAKKDK